MYYTIKIITKDSEFGLESTDKAIIEREMDLYFASIFDVSENFKSRIRNLEINYKRPAQQNDVVPKTGTSFNNKIIPDLNIQKPTNNNTIGKQEDIKKENKIDFTQDFINLAKQVDNTKKVTEEIKPNTIIQENTNLFKPENHTTNYKKDSESMISEIFSGQSFSKPQSEDTENKNDNRSIIENSQTSGINNELEQEAQRMFEQLQTNVKMEKMESMVKTETMESLIQKQNNLSGFTNTENNIQKNETLHMPQHPDIIIDDQLPDINQVESQQDTINSDNNEERKIVSFEVDAKSEKNSPFQDVIDVYNEQEKIRSSQNNIEASINNNQNTAPDNNQSNSNEQKINLQEPVQEPKENIAKDVTANNTAYSNISIETFLSGFTTDNIYDEFIICASYIKNILKQDDFTMKYINSKLFQATGKIADTSIVDELIQKEYIKNVIIDDYIKYTLTPKGEEYLASKIPS